MTRTFAKLCKGNITATIIAAAAPMVLGAISAGCTLDRPTSGDPASITILVYSSNWWRPGLDSHAPVFLSLFHEHGGEVHGQLVKSWEKSGADLWTYHLRTDVRWHDGVPVTAHDVKFTLELLSHPDVLEIPASATAEVVDDSTATIAFQWQGRGTWTPFEAELPILPKHLLEGLDPAEFKSWEFWSAPVGNGPYRFVRQSPETMVELEANPDFFGEKPRIERVILKFAWGAPAWMQLQGGEVAVADLHAADPGDVRALAMDPGFQVYWTLSDWIRNIQWNLGHPILRDAAIRRGISLAIDRAELAVVLDYPGELPRYDVPITSAQRRRLDFPEPASFDPEQAATLFENAGWFDRDGDGIRDKDGEEFRFTILSGGSPIAVLIQDQLRRVGVATDIETMQRPAMDQRKEGGRWGMDVSRSGAFLHVLLPMADSVWGYRNPALLSLAEAADRAVDPEIRDSLFRAMWPILSRDHPVSYLVPEGIPVLAHQRVRGLSTPDQVSAARHLHELWIEGRQ